VTQKGKSLTPEKCLFVAQFLERNSKPFPNVAVKEKIPETEAQRYRRRKDKQKKVKRIVPCRCITAPTWTALFIRYQDETSEMPELQGKRMCRSENSAMHC
jgi:hypothetical protein